MSKIQKKQAVSPLPSAEASEPYRHGRCLGCRDEAGGGTLTAVVVWRLLTCMPALAQYDAKLRSYLEEYDKAFLVHADNVGSKQFMDIRAVRPCAGLAAFNVIRCWCA